MNISKKWSVAAATALTLAIVGGGAVSANAAPGDPVNPQPNGSKGSFFLYNADTGELADGDTTRVYTRSEGLIASASSTDVLAEINPAPARPVTGATPFTGVYRFLSTTDAADRDGGTNTWNAFATDAAAGPNGGTMVPDFTLDAIFSGPGGIADDIAAGGTYWYGVAYTINSGVTVVGTVYREINITAGSGNYTVGAVEVEGAAPADLITEADLVTANPALVTETVDSKQLAITAGAANANKTLSVGVFSAGARSELGTVVLDANGAGTVDASAVAVGAASKLFLYELNGPDEALAAWDNFTLTSTAPVYDTSDTTDLTVTVTNSGRFELVAPAATLIDLGNVRRNQTTVPVALGQFTVFDDRDVLSGWNLNVTAADFAGAGNTTVAKNALGYAPRAVALTDGVTLGAAKAAGAGAFGVLAEGIAGSSTAEVGAVLDTDLTFKAPINAAKGVHTSTLTLDLVSK
ncbi:hypothetical protein [Agromyces subbeticus]|uniref:hypothetical protein n=1 Tax=Agromyces subbeticus TaxID=293890 RepID=UPI0003B594B2|nr:hypothetical protein [Agromyces subbeticus]